MQASDEKGTCPLHEQVSSPPACGGAPPEQDGEAPVSSGAVDALHLHRFVIDEGRGELRRSSGSLFWSGLAAGLSVTASLMAEGAFYEGLPDLSYRELIVALGYPVGFIIVILSKMQLFTESTITAALPLALRPGKRVLYAALHLWIIVLFANFLGTAIATGLIDAGLLLRPEMRNSMLTVASVVTKLGPLDTFINAIPAGFLIAIIPWAGPNAGDSKFWLILMITWLIGVAGFTHSIVGSAEAFLLMFAGHTGAWFTFVQFLLPAVLGNLVGGAGIFAILVHGQVRDDIAAQK